MGQPVKIAELAPQMIELSDYVPDRDIPIQFTGLRPGEKLYEELLIDPEQAKRGLPIQEFSLPRASAGNDNHSGRDRSTEESNRGKRFGSCLECDVQTGPRVWSIGAESAFTKPFHCRQIFMYWLGELAFQIFLNSIRIRLQRIDLGRVPF